MNFKINFIWICGLIVLMIIARNIIIEKIYVFPELELSFVDSNTGEMIKDGFLLVEWKSAWIHLNKTQLILPKNGVYKIKQRTFNKYRILGGGASEVNLCFYNIDYESNESTYHLSEVLDTNVFNIWNDKKDLIYPKNEKGPIKVDVKIKALKDYKNDKNFMWGVLCPIPFSYLDYAYQFKIKIDYKDVLNKWTELVRNNSQTEEEFKRNYKQLMASFKNRICFRENPELLKLL